MTDPTPEAPPHPADDDPARSAPQSGAPRATASVVRRTIVAVIIITFSLAALGGIVALLGFELGDTALRVVATTAIVGAFSVAVLCCAALLGRAAQVVGIVGVAISTITCAMAIWLIWFADVFGASPDLTWKILSTGITLTAAFALASLLLLLADRRRTPVRIGMVITLALFAIVAALIVYVIWGSDTVDDKIYPRFLGVTAILAALGAVVIPVLSILLPDTGARTHTRLSPATSSRLEEEARRRGVTPDALVATLLDAAEPDPRHPPRQPTSGAQPPMATTDMRTDSSDVTRRPPDGM